MPIYEYDCDACGGEFESLVLGSDAPSCPACASSEVTKRLSLPRVQSEGTRRQAMRAARQRDRRMGENRMRERIEYESSHDD